MLWRMEMVNGFMPIKEAALLWGVTERWIQRLCKQGRIIGAKQMGRLWLIPNDAARPEDLRHHSNKNPISFCDESFDIENFYGTNTKLIRNTESCKQYRIQNAGGVGVVTQYELFDGVKLHYHDFHAERLDFGAAPPTFPERIISIQHCREGRFEGEYSNGEFIYLGEGDLSVNPVARSPIRSSFPLSHFHGISIIIFVDDANQAFQEHGVFFYGMQTALECIYEKLCDGNRLMILRSNATLEHLLSELYQPQYRQHEDLLKVKLLELLLFLGITDIRASKEHPYFHKKQVLVIKEIHKLLVGNLDRHFNQKELSECFKIPLTSMKNCFKGVYGQPINTYMREFRIHTAAELLRTTLLSTATIAERVGYENPSKFTEAFKKRMRCTPTEYRNLNCLIGAADDVKD